MKQNARASGTSRSSAGRFADLDRGEAHVLTLFRLFMEEFTRPGRQTWMAALVHAENHLADRGGARLAYGVLAAVQALRQCRPVDFTFHPATCRCCSQRLSADERLLCAAFAAARASDHRALSCILSHLVYGPDHAGLDTILLLLAQDFAGSPDPATPAAQI